MKNNKENTGDLDVRTQNYKEQEGLLGNVESVYEKHYGVIETNGKLYLTELKDNYNWRHNTINHFNEKGLRIKEERLAYYDNSYTLFDDHEFEVGSTQFNDDGSLKYSHKRINNNEGKTLEDFSFNEKGIQTHRSTWHYDDRGNCIKIISFDKDDTLTSTSNWVYGEEKEWTEFIKIDAAGQITLWAKHILNDQGKIIESIDLNPDGSVKGTQSFAQYYDSEGNWIIKNKGAKSNKELYKTIVENDHHGNWIKKVNYFCEKPINAYKRKITYHREDPLPAEIVLPFELPFILFNSTRVETDEKCINDYLYYDNEDTYTVAPRLSLEEAKWLAEKSSNADIFPYFYYYMLYNKEQPSHKIFYASDVEIMAMIERMKDDEFAEVIHSSCANYHNKGAKGLKYTLAFPEHPGYILYITHIEENDAEEYIIPDYFSRFGIGDDGFVRTSQMILLYPSSPFRDEESNDILSSINYYLEIYEMRLVPDKPEIYMVEVDSKGNFTLESHYIRDDFEIEDLDVNYGFGFEQFHKDLINRFTREHKGLVLFHGIPGTGKTYYIRHLLREMAIANKIVIYMPPNMVDYMVEPSFMSFISQTVKRFSSNNQTCVLLIEDAEPLLVARQAEGRVQGITNLLNMTDGLLNDMLKLQIICTFNVELKQLDTALIRQGRLIARKEFKPLPELDANLLAQRLGIKHHFEEPTTLSEIYAKLKNQDTIIHEDY